jgi:hypothetical protein
MKKRITYLIAVLSLLMLSSRFYAQNDKLAKADELYRAKNAKAARSAIDSVVNHPETKKDPSAWTLRGYIYYDIYKTTDKQKLYSALRDSSLRSLFISQSLKPSEDIQTQNKTLIKNFSQGYYGICKSLLQDSANFERSQIAFKKYKELYSKVDSTFDFKPKDIEYYSAVGSQFSDKFNNDNSKTQFGETGKVALMKVLDLDPKNISANINLGIIYYNQGVNLINQMDLDTPLEKLEVIQDNSAKLFKQSLPFMNKVYQLDPKNLKALESLRQIYQALNDSEKSLEFNKKLEEAKKAN